MIMSMHNPPHPGENIRLSCLEPLHLSVTAGAKALGVSRQALSSLLNGKAGVSPEMAVRLSRVFGSTARHWLQLQLNYDLWHAEQRAGELKIDRLVHA
jgi:addiction module HigA family antidote